MEITTWLKKRLNSGLLEKAEFDAKVKLLEANTDKLVSDEEAKAISKQLGIIDEEEAGFVSPEKKATKKLKFDPKDEEANKKA